MDLGDLGTVRLPWWRLRGILANLPTGSAFARSVHGPKVEWSATEHLLASAVDALRAANWQRGEGKGQRPKPVVRPGHDDRDTTRFGTSSMTVADADVWLKKVNRGG